MNKRVENESIKGTLENSLVGEQGQYSIAMFHTFKRALFVTSANKVCRSFDLLCQEVINVYTVISTDSVRCDDVDLSVDIGE